MEEIIISPEPESFEELLIISVQEFKCLYSKTDSDFHNKLKKEKAWADISERTGKPVKVCQNRWKTLRERFSREMRKQQMPSGSGTKSQSSGTWMHFNSMSFLKDFVLPRQTRTNDDTNPDLF